MREIAPNIKEEFDVIVAGGGIAGVDAAVATSRAGALCAKKKISMDCVREFYMDEIRVM